MASNPTPVPWDEWLARIDHAPGFESFRGRRLELELLQGLDALFQAHPAIEGYVLWLDQDGGIASLEASMAVRIPDPETQEPVLATYFAESLSMEMGLLNCVGWDDFSAAWEELRNTVPARPTDGFVRSFYAHLNQPRPERAWNIEGNVNAWHRVSDVPHLAWDWGGAEWRALLEQERLEGVLSEPSLVSRRPRM